MYSPGLTPLKRARPINRPRANASALSGRIKARQRQRMLDCPEGLMSKRYTAYFSDNGWASSKEPPWDGRPTAENEWAASAAAVWANQRHLGWPERARVFEKLRQNDAKINEGRVIPPRAGASDV